MDIFGLGDAAKHIGTPQSIAIRNPDCSVATYLISQVRQSLSITQKESRDSLTIIITFNVNEQKFLVLKS